MYFRITPLSVAGMTLCAALVFHTTVLSSSPQAEEDQPAESRSHFLDAVGSDHYAQTTPPSEAPVFRWDFSREVEHVFSYQQELHQTMDMGQLLSEGGGSVTQEMMAEGQLVIRAHGNSTADLLLRGLQAHLRFATDEDSVKEMDTEFPLFVVQGIEEDGSGPFGCTNQESMLQMLFPLPKGPLQVGESVDMPVQMPFDAMGSLLMVKGLARITLTGYVSIDSRRCAQLDVETDISDLNVPPELEGVYTCAARASSRFYFDVDSRAFVGGTVACLIELAADISLPAVETDGDDCADLPERITMSMVGDNLIRVRLAS